MAFISSVGAVGCGFVAAMQRMADLIEATKALARAQETGGATRRCLTLTPAPSSRDFSENVLAQHPRGIATALEMATRGIGAHSEAMRSQLQGATDATVSTLSAQTRTFADRLETSARK